MIDKLTSILELEQLQHLLPFFTDQGVTDSVLKDLTDADLKELGVDKLGERKRLLAAFGKSDGIAVAVSGIEETPAQNSSGGPSKTTSTPAEATKDSPWVNTLGMPFVPIPRFETRFCIWPVRVQDYEAYCMASGAKFPEIPFPQDSDHPIVGVSWNDAVEFCVWLTGKERSEGKIDDKTVYRLPTDLEWSAAVGLPYEPEEAPAERHLKTPGYPWGLRWPPPPNAGNYEHEREDQLALLSKAAGIEDIARPWMGTSRDVDHYTHCRTAESIKESLARWKARWKPVDQYEFTSPVEAFAKNDLGIYDLAGNVWEWCMDDILHKDESAKVARGGSFSLCPLEGISVGPVVYHGGEYFHDESAKPERVSTLFPMQNVDTYKSSYRHFGSGEQSLTSHEFGSLVPGNWENVPCGGFRAVLVAC